LVGKEVKPDESGKVTEAEKPATKPDDQKNSKSLIIGVSIGVGVVVVGSGIGIAAYCRAKFREESEESSMKSGSDEEVGIEAARGGATTRELEMGNPLGTSLK
jgi:hypothetical protein